MLNDMQMSLSRIERALRKLGRSTLLTALRPGAPADRTRAVLEAVGLSSDQQIETLYHWRDGTRTQGIGSIDDIHMFPGFYLLSAEDAVANYRAFVADARWSRSWLPIFANGGGDFYVVDVGEEAQGRVRHFRIDETDHPVEFPSLEAMVATLAEGFDRRVFFVDSAGFLEMDDLAFGSLAAETNPEIPWWQG